MFSHSVVPDSATPWTAARQAFLSINFWSLLKFKSIASVMPSSHLILCCPLLLLPSIFPNIRVFSSESALAIRWPKYWSFSFSINPSNEYSGLISLEPRTVLEPQFRGIACGRQCQSATELSSSLVGGSLRFVLQAESLYSSAGAGTQLPCGDAQHSCPINIPGLFNLHKTLNDLICAPFFLSSVSLTGACVLSCFSGV